MKKISKIIIGILLSFCFTSQSNAQLSGGATLGLFNSFAQGADAQFGFNLYGKYEVTDNIRIGANLGYYFRGYETFGVKFRSFTTPITGLAEYSFTDNDLSPYAGINIGIYRAGTSGNGNSLAVSDFGLAPVVGINYSLSRDLLVNGNVKYHYAFTDFESTSVIGVNVGLSYQF